jgi:NADH-quinone oxidoreductase subunit L
MTWPLIVLAVFSLIIGWLGIPFLGNQFGVFLGGALGAEHGAEHADLVLDLVMMAISTLVALSGIYVAYRLYGVKAVATAADDPLRKLGRVYTALEHKLYFDELYSATIVRGTLAVSELARLFDVYVIDGIVNAAGKLTVVFSAISRWFDVYIVDGLVNFSGWITGKLGGLLRNLQTGQVQNYMMLVLIGLVLMAAVYLYW